MTSPAAVRTRRPAPSRRTLPPRLRVVPPPIPRLTAAPFAALVVAILAAGLLTMLWLSTLSAQSSFHLLQLERETAQLSDREETLTLQVSHLDSPQVLAARAWALGLVPARSVRFVPAPTAASVAAACPPSNTGARSICQPAPQPRAPASSGAASWQTRPRSATVSAPTGGARP